MKTDCSGCASAPGCSSAATAASTLGDSAPVALPATAQLQRRRRWFQAVFFAVFLLAPALNLLRFDLTEAQLWVLGFRWSLGIEAFMRGEASAMQTAWSIVWRGILPVLTLVVGFLAVAYHFGRLYCGWLCPHFSLVETLNDLLHRATGKLSVWDKSPTPRLGRSADKRWWPVFLVACLVFGFAWAITLLTYLLPPAMIWGNLVNGTLTPNQALRLRGAVLSTDPYTDQAELAGGRGHRANYRVPHSAFGGPRPHDTSSVDLPNFFQVVVP